MFFDKKKKQKFLNASCSGDLNAINHYINDNINVNCRSDSGDTALNYAALNGHLDIVIQLIEAGADLDATNNFYSTALHLSIMNGHTDIALYLIEAGADVNIATESGDTAIIYAAYKGDLETVLALIEAGADIHAKNNRGDTALDFAIGSGFGDIEAALKDAEKKHPPPPTVEAKTPAEEKEKSEAEAENNGLLNSIMPASGETYRLVDAQTISKYEGQVKGKGELISLFNFRSKTITEVHDGIAQEPIKFDDFAGSKDEDILKAYEWALKKGADVLNPVKKADRVDIKKKRRPQ